MALLALVHQLLLSTRFPCQCRCLWTKRRSRTISLLRTSVQEVKLDQLSHSVAQTILSTQVISLMSQSLSQPNSCHTGWSGHLTSSLLVRAQAHAASCLAARWSLTLAPASWQVL